MQTKDHKLIEYVKRISESGVDIYTDLVGEKEEFYIPSTHLETILLSSLKNQSLKGMPLRSRSRFVKEQICKALGYPIPGSFKKTKPKFIGQNFDIYSQKSKNLQIWNDQIDDRRRYVILIINSEDLIINVKVINGNELVKLDKTGTFTTKLQAKIKKEYYQKTILCSLYDTENLRKFIIHDVKKFNNIKPSDDPIDNLLMPINDIYDNLKSLVGQKFDDLGADQERNRGTVIHKKVIEVLGYNLFSDNGQFPDVLNQLLEIKLQLSPTIDLGQHNPISSQPINTSSIKFFNSDVRYAIFFASKEGSKVIIKNLILVTGKDFFTIFDQFQGKVINKKIQIPLPKELFF
jgi:hypothetical protein